MPGFEAEPDNLRDSSGLLRQASESLAELWAEIDGKVASMGDIFGDDDVGGLIGMSYQAAHDIAAENITSVIDALGGFSEGLDGMAASYDETENALMENFAKFER
ncbi:hypothetical protein AB0I28_29380 [Phytomonospora sp. NPDC050363]|uniref:WXG100 family type VII secretion target n=1 Tax=Phytomonospora sp. NPDC050363 TaxID=3155642 RepID=UPI0033CD87B5